MILNLNFDGEYLDMCHAIINACLPHFDDTFVLEMMARIESGKPLTENMQQSIRNIYYGFKLDE